jgi:excisionase family DNA binding protein
LTLDADSVPPGQRQTAEYAARAVLELLQNDPNSANISLNAVDVTLPREVAVMLERILASMAAGESLTLIPAYAELTTQQSAELLGVSRPYVIGLLDRGKIEYHRVGSHRPVNAASLRAYQDQMRSEQRKAADELSALTAELNLY